MLRYNGNAYPQFKYTNFPLIDYTKIRLLNIDRQRLEKLSFLEFKTEVSEKTGLLSNKKVAIYHFCKISIYDSGLILFTGSIHKLWNSLNNIKAPNYNTQKYYKGYNGNQFNLSNILLVREHLCLLFDCEPKQMEFQNIEFGINTNLIFNPQLFITSLLFHCGKPFEFRFNRRYAEVVHKRYRIKIYNKSEQYGMNRHTLRIEVSHKKAIDFKSTGIKTFEDINQITLNKALELLLERFSEVVYHDKTIDKTKLNKGQIKRLNNYSDITYWLDTLKPNKRDKPKKDLQKIITENSKNLHAQIKDNLIEKGVIINRVLKNQKRVIINYSNIELNTTESRIRKCLVTGLDLDREKEDAKYVRTTTLNHLKKNDRATFQQLCSMFLNRSSKRPKYESSIIPHLAKQIRNRYYNPTKIKQQGYNQRVYKNQFELNLV